MKKCLIESNLARYMDLFRTILLIFDILPLEGVVENKSDPSLFNFIFLFFYLLGKSTGRIAEPQIHVFFYIPCSKIYL